MAPKTTRRRPWRWQSLHHGAEAEGVNGGEKTQMKTLDKRRIWVGIRNGVVSRNFCAQLVLPWCHITPNSEHGLPGGCGSAEVWAWAGGITAFFCTASTRKKRKIPTASGWAFNPWSAVKAWCGGREDSMQGRAL